MELTDRDKETIKNCIDRGEPLPAKYKLMLFADAPDVELVWQGKTSEVTNVVLPFQSIEQIDEPRQQVGQQIDSLFAAGHRGRKDRFMKTLGDAGHYYSQSGIRTCATPLDTFGYETSVALEAKL